MINVGSAHRKDLDGRRGTRTGEWQEIRSALGLMDRNDAAQI